MVIILRSTLTILSMMGMIKNKPGPLIPANLPSLKITPLSYSRQILIAWKRIIKKIGSLDLYLMNRVDKAMKVSLGLD